MILSLMFLILFLSLILLFFVPSSNLHLIRVIALCCTGLVLILSVILLNFFYSNTYYFQNLIVFKTGIDLFNIYFTFGLDGLSLFFIILSAFLTFLCVIFIWTERHLKEYVLSLIFLELILFLLFSTLNLFFFYIFFEAVLIPMYFLIGFFGSRERKIRAAYLFFFYTLVGSLCLLFALMYIYVKTGTLNYEYLYYISFSTIEQRWLWLAFFFSFASKIPLFPFHIWLPEAHVEAPTVGSVLLAGILLKLGVYGFLRFNLNLFIDASFFFSPLVHILSIFGIIYASMNALRQTDMKRIIAYSSVAHMNLITMGIFSFNVVGIAGSILQSISHGFVSGALFFLVGILYKRYHSRYLFYYSGLTHMMPFFSFFFCFFTMANIALPGTSSFVGEFLLLYSIFQFDFFSCFFATLGVIICGAYSLWLYNRVCFGNLKLGYLFLYEDLDLKEFFVLFFLGFFVLLIGVYPELFLQYLQFSCSSYILLF